MKKLAIFSTLAGYFASAGAVFAQIQIQRPGVGYDNISDFLNAIIRLIFIIALILVLFMLVWGALQWIFSGGNKDAVGAARERIIHALVGLAILAVAFALVVLAGQFIGIDLLGRFIVPSPAVPTPPLPRPSPQF